MLREALEGNALDIAAVEPGAAEEMVAYRLQTSGLNPERPKDAQESKGFRGHIRPWSAIERSGGQSHPR